MNKWVVYRSRMNSAQSIARGNFVGGCSLCVPSRRWRSGATRAVHVRASAANVDLPIMVNSCSGKVREIMSFTSGYLDCIQCKGLCSFLWTQIACQERVISRDAYLMNCRLAVFLLLCMFFVGYM